MLPQSTVIAGRYEVLGALGSGGAAHVLKVLDRKEGAERALKIVRTETQGGDGSLLQAFHREFSLLKTLRHPHLVQVHDFGAHPVEGAATPWYTMDLIPGRAIDRALPTPPHWPRIARCADAVLQALGTLHQSGLIHGDVTCNNILVGADVDRDPPLVWLMDLGLADRMHGRYDGVVRGTVATVAPELLAGSAVDGRADLYALGCVLYRLATGQDPFVGASPWDVLRAHLRTTPTSPRELNPDLPASLESLILALLQKSPNERPASATEVRKWLAPFSGRDVRDDATLERPLAPSFAGRERELALFHDLLRELGGGRGTTLLVMGTRGLGHTRLLEEFRLAARLSGLGSTLVAARDAPPRPFGVADILLSGAPERGNGTAATTRLDRFAALLERGPAVWLVDDALAADGASRDALRQLAQRASEAHWPLLLVLSLADESDHGEEWLADELLERGQARALRLRPLETAAIERVGASMLGRPTLSPAWTSWLQERSGGIPWLIEEAVGELVSSGAIARDPELRSAPQLRHDTSALPARRSQEWLEQRWKQLDESARSVLAAVAVAGGAPVRFAELEQLGPRASGDPQTIDTLLSAGLARRVADRGGGFAVAMIAPNLASVVQSWLPRATLRTLHLRRAEALAGASGAEAQRAQHLIAADQPDAAIGLLAIAASRALDERLPREALRLADQGLALPVQDNARSAPLLRVRALALAAAGRTDEAQRAFERAITAARSAALPQQRADTLLSAGKFVGERGDAALALAYLEEALALCDELGDVAGGSRVLIELGRQLERLGRTADAETRLNSALSQARRAHASDLEAEVLLALGEWHARTGKTDRAGELFRAAEAASRDSGGSTTRAAAQRGRILLLLSGRRWNEALDEADALGDQAHRSADRAVEAEAHALAARAATALGRRKEAQRRWEEAHALRASLGQFDEAGIAIAASARLLLERGQARAAGAKLSEERSRALRRGPSAALTQLTQTAAWVAAWLGDVEATRALLPESERASEAPLEKAERLLTLGLAYTQAGQPDAARAALQEACFIARRHQQGGLEAEGLLLLAEAYAELHEDDRASLALKRVRQLADAGLGAELGARARLALAERELSTITGDMQLACDEAEAAAQVLSERERIDLVWRAHAAIAQSASKLGQLGKAHGAEAEAVRWLEALLGGLPDTARASLRRKPKVTALLDQRATAGSGEGGSAGSDRAESQQLAAFERLWEVNRTLNSTLDLHAQLQTLLDTALELTGAERGFVLLEQGGATAVEMARGAGGADLAGTDREFSRGVARRVMQGGEPIWSHDAQADERLATSSSVHALRIHSLLAAPLRVKNVVAGALVLDSRRVGSLLDGNHQQWVLRLAEQGGIALANARLVDELRRQAEEIQRLNEKLSQQVEEQRVEILEKQSNLEVRYRFDSLTGASAAMQKLYRALDKIIPTEIPVLITGESGTGKDLVARVLHYNGPRAKQRFVTVNCAALTDTLLESELFGHRRGAFTGADRDRKGLFEQADGGTLFLDEIGEMPMALQPKLLRAIQFGEVRRVGEDTSRNVDVRILAATHRDLQEQVRLGRFREDLMYRLDVARVQLAPLRERLEDIGLLVDMFLEDQATKSNRARHRMEPAALRLFLRYHWPGNVRELENEVIKLAAFCENELISEIDVLENAAFLDKAQPSGTTGASDIATLEAAEIEQIRSALKVAGGNRTKAAEALGIDRSTLYRKLKRLGEAD